jgi:hypothetical protein
MDESQYKYLDEERVKLWRELRLLQDQVETISSVVGANVSDEQKALI